MDDSHRTVAEIRDGDLNDLEGYSWVPFFEELASSILPYRDTQGTLISILRKMNEAVDSDPTTNLTTRNKNEEEIPLEEMDPFSFFGLLCRFRDPEKIKRATDFLKDEFELDAQRIKPDIRGLPRTNATNCRFTSWKYRRGENDTDLLWEFAEQVIQSEPCTDWGEGKHPFGDMVNTFSG